MALSVQELEDMRDALIRNRARGVRVLEHNGEKVQYGSDVEMRKAIADLDARILSAQHKTPRIIRFGASKGV